MTMADSKTTPAKKANKVSSAKAVAKKKTSALAVDMFDMSGKSNGSMELPTDLFKVIASPKLLAQYVRVYLANQRQGTHQTKTRADVTGSTRKIYKQKGTGRARHGARTAPIFVGGGVTFGPQSRSHNLKMTKKQKQKALLFSLSLKAQDKNIKILDGISNMKGTVKEMKEALKSLEVEPRKALVVYAPEQADTMKKVLGNVKDAHTSQSRLLNAYAVLKAETIVFTKEALEDFVKFRSIEN